MEYVTLGKTGIKVSRFAFGTLTMSPIQRDISPQEGGKLIRRALEEGITFLDGAQGYRTYPHIKEAIKDYRGEVVIASKSHAKDYETMEKAVQEALGSLDLSEIDIFLLHGVQSKETLKEREEAFKCLLDMKDKGYIKSVGLSTHNIDVVEEATNMPEVEVIHPIFNKVNFGLINENNKNPGEVIRKAYETGKGIYAMKPLAGGHLYKEVKSSLEYVFGFPYIHTTAVGMTTEKELEVNLKIFRKEKIEEEELKATAIGKRMFVSRFCKGCKACLEECAHEALSMKGEKAYIDESKCILCGYCRKNCPSSCIRII